METTAVRFDRERHGFCNADSPSRRSRLDESQRSVNTSAIDAGASLTDSSATGFNARATVSIATLGGSKKVIKGEPPAGMQDMVSIKNVFDVYKAVSILAGMVSSCWGASNGNVSLYRQVMPGLVRVYVGHEVFTCQGFLLQDLEPILIRAKSAPSGGINSSVSDPSIVEARCRAYTPYFKHILILLKLRWLLRLHSACCELDYKMCSCANLFKGLQYIVLQQYAEAEADSVFDSKVSQNGSHVNIESIMDDIFDRLHRGMGTGWRGFLEFVSTCDPHRCLHNSAMDMTEPQVISNAPHMIVIDTVFVTCFLRGSHELPFSDLKGCFEHIKMLGLQMPLLPPLNHARNLQTWCRAKMKPTRQEREKASKKGIEKLAQLDAVLLCAAMELKSDEILATPEELAEMTTLPQRLSSDFAGDVAPVVEEFGSTGQAALEFHFNEDKQPAHDMYKVQLSPAIFDAVVHCVNHHMTFPTGIRERMYQLIIANYGLTSEQGKRLTIAMSQNVDGKRLPEYVLHEMGEREKIRIRKFEATFGRDCAHLLHSPLVPCMEERHRPAKYTVSSPGFQTDKEFRLRMTRSLPRLKSPSVDSKEPFRVPLCSGPLTLDPVQNRLRTTGFFIKMPPL